MCHESIKGPLDVVKCFDNNYCTHCEHGNPLLPLFGGPEISDSFENEILVLHKNMRLEVIKVIKPFLQFLKTFDGGRDHNLMAIMLDLHFKSLRIVEDLLGHGNAIQLATEYDAKIVTPLLMVYFEWLNPITINASIATTIVDVVGDVVGEEFEENMFGANTSIFTCIGYLKIISIYDAFCFAFCCVDLFTWWHIHEG
jgi:hypothetical protein